MTQCNGHQNYSFAMAVCKHGPKELKDPKRFSMEQWLKTTPNVFMNLTKHYTRLSRVTLGQSTENKCPNNCETVLFGKENDHFVSNCISIK